MVRDKEVERPDNQADCLILEVLYNLDELFAMSLDLLLLRVLHVLYVRQDTSDVGPPRLYTQPVCPADFEMSNSTPVAFAYIEQPVEDIIVVFSIENDSIGAVEDRRRFVVDVAARSEEARVCRG